MNQATSCIWIKRHHLFKFWGGQHSTKPGIWEKLKYYLQTLNRPENTSEESISYQGELKRRNKPFPQIVVSNPQLQQARFKALNES